ncbi:MAG TPA: aspartate/glutamate racemase family protein [Alphaproteobacteria bacterium]|nr:aspartate/glutamate racemase family protein [Alphaproteobacteria bacterium]
MRTLGLIGGMSWESTAVYYRMLNESVRSRLGGLHSAELLMHSFDFAPIAAMQAAGEWDRAAATLADAARRLERGGAAALVLCTNTMHKLAPAIEAAVGIPLLHIADTTAEAIKRSASRRPILLATRFTMEQDFYTGRLRERHGIEALVPDAEDRATIHRIIYEELCQGVVAPASKAAYLDIVARLRAAGGDGVILGCTEITLLVGQADFDIPVFDTTRLHAEAALDFALAERAAA